MFLASHNREENPAGPLQLAEELAARFAAEAGDWDHRGRVPAGRIEDLAHAGLLTLPLENPGSRWWHGTPDVLRALTAIGSGDLSIGRLYEGHINAVLLVERFGIPAQRRKMACSVSEHGHLLSVWNTDAAMPVTLTRSGVSWRLEGAKSFASGAGLVSLALITAQRLDGGRQMVLIPSSAFEDRIDARSWRPLGMRASMSFNVDFSGLSIEAAALLGKPDDYLAEPWFSAGCIRFGAVQLGGALAILKVVHAHLRSADRHRDPQQQERFARMRVAAEGARLWLNRVGAAMDGPPTPTDLRALVDLANMSRHAVEKACGLILNLSVQCVGARGMLAPHPLERLVRDLMTYLRQPAPDEATLSVGRQALEAERMP